MGYLVQELVSNPRMMWSTLKNFADKDQFLTKLIDISKTFNS